MNCIICGQETKYLFNKNVLIHETLDYYRCEQCGFIQTIRSYSLDYPYSTAIADTDIGLVGRNIGLSKSTFDLICCNFDMDKKYLDYAGGYGIFVRLMRDQGIDFYWYDKYCENIFAKHFIANDPKSDYYEMVTAFELMEHIDDPDSLLKEIFACTDSFLFSTVIIPENNIENWWYLATETGQHISFYSLESLRILAEKHYCNFYSNGKTLHLISKKTFKKNPLKKTRSLFSRKKCLSKSLLQKDYEFIKKHINSNKDL